MCLGAGHHAGSERTYWDLISHLYGCFFAFSDCSCPHTHTPIPPHGARAHTPHATHPQVHRRVAGGDPVDTQRHMPSQVAARDMLLLCAEELRFKHCSGPAVVLI